MADNDSESSPPIPPSADRDLANVDGFDDEEYVTERRNGGEGTSTHPDTETGASETDKDEDEDDLDGEVVGSVEENQEKVSKDDEDDDKGGLLKVFFCCCASLVCIALVVLLYFLLRRDEMGLARAQLDPSTNAPTFILDTDSPTPLTTIAPTGVTPEPTSGPTPSPTLPPISPSGEKSRLNCEQINLAAAEAPGENKGDGNFRPLETLPDGTQVCGDTFGALDPQRPNRNQWSVRIGRRNCPSYNYAEGFAICDSVGARWCTVDEFIAEVAHGTGCGGDREFVYTNTDCFDEDAGVPGKVMFDVGLRDTRKPFFFCESDLTRPSLARCCGDAVL